MSHGRKQECSTEVTNTSVKLLTRRETVPKPSFQNLVSMAVARISKPLTGVIWPPQTAYHAEYQSYCN